MKLAVIPARGGSKRIPRKNIRAFRNQPMIAWSIHAALKSACFDSVVVSTDDEEIADIARAHGADVPFMRPAALSDDHTPTIPVIAHAIDWHRQRKLFPSVVCCIYATAPFIRPTDIQEGYERLYQHQCDYVFSVTRYGFPIQRALRLDEDGSIAMFQPENFCTRSQDLEEAFHDAGQFYWGQADAWVNGKPIFSAHSHPVILPAWRVQDIDTAEDWERAERLFAAQTATELRNE
jgi:pseudaminic acid cytidylyltransferase